MSWKRGRPGLIVIAAEVLTLAVHELATDATKYGAISAPDGFVDIIWSKDMRADQEWLCLDWTELRVVLPSDVGRRDGVRAMQQRRIRIGTRDLDRAVLDVNLGKGPSFERAREMRSRGIPFLFTC